MYKILGLAGGESREEVDRAYRNSKRTFDDRVAWKILRDPYYSKVYDRHRVIYKIIEAGFFDDGLDSFDSIYNLELLTTPIHKLNLDCKDKTPVVLLSTGGFYPIHAGHINMMEQAKIALEERGYHVAGGYFSPCHDDYVSTKEYFHDCANKRVYDCQKSVCEHDWLMIDPFEALYSKTTLNFTDIIERLELYLRKYVDERIEVAYVFGADNAKFAYCFEDKGIGVCMNRENGAETFKQMRLEIDNERVLFINNKECLMGLSSRYIREKSEYAPRHLETNGKYIIRDEGTPPLSHIEGKIGHSKACEIQSEFLNGLVEIWKGIFEHLDIEVVKLSDEVEYANSKMHGLTTISMDSYYHGNENLEISRKFNLSDAQIHSDGLIGRDGNELTEQVSRFKPGNYVLVDDDSVSGTTINTVKKLLPDGITITDVFLLSSYIKGNPVDVVDCRDFMVGALNSGLVVKGLTGRYMRVPYMKPYVSLVTRASVPEHIEMEVGKLLWELNYEMYSKIPDVVIGDMNKDFIELMESIGFSRNNSMKSVCEWHKDKIKELWG